MLPIKICKVDLEVWNNQILTGVSP